MIDRRSFLASGALAAALGAAPRIAFASAAGEQRFLFVIQRGAADGLHSLVPLADPGLRAARAALVDGLEEPVKLDSLFSLHPALVNAAALFRDRQALFLHAVATTYRDRSHFDAQNLLETGGIRPYAERSGWINRMLDLLPGARAMALAQAVPMALRGDHPVASYAPTRRAGPTPDLAARVASLYAGDRQLHDLWSQATQTAELVDDLSVGNGRGGKALGDLAARLLAPADGARVMMVETGGWDTHTAQKGRLAAQLGGLDALIGALKAGLGPAWDRTLVVVATEFGRTVAVNGTGGTDHGTAAVAMLFGGKVRGGRVLADWPGLRQSDLHEGRDLRPTQGLEDVIAGAVAGHFALDPEEVGRRLYPSIDRMKPLSGLIHAR